MKVKNMVRNRQSAYLKLMQINNKDFSRNLIVGAVALLLAIIASKISNSFFVCVIGILSLVLSGAETVFKLIKGTKDVKLDTLLVLVSVIIPFCLGDFVMAATAMAIYKLSVAVISYLLGDVGNQLGAYVNVCPKTANIIDGEANIKVIRSEEIVKGTKIMVKTGEIVPVDSTITEGFSDFDTSAVCELGKDETLSSGDRVLAGYVNLGASVTCVAECDYEDSVVQDMNRLADMAETTSTNAEKRFIKIAKWYPVLILALSIIVLLICGLSNGAWGDGMSVVSVFLVACTTSSFMVAVPLFTTCVVWKLKKKGMAVASAEELDEIVFNYVTECMDNGTARELTHGILSKEFIDKHRRELMIKLANIFAGSDYSDKDTAAMMCELLNQEQFDEEQM